MPGNVRNLPMGHRAAKCDCGWTAPYTMRVEIEGHAMITAMGSEKLRLILRITCPVCGRGTFRMEKNLE